MTAETPYSEIPDELRSAQLARMFIERDVENRVHAIFDRVRTDRLRGLPEPRNILIHGDTGVGKSKILSRYVAKHPEHRTEQGTIKRSVLYVEIKNATNPASLAKHMLTRLGITEPAMLKGSAADLSRTVKTQLVAQQVEIVLLDEFSNAIPENGRAQTSNIATWVKDLSKAKTRTPEHPDGLPGEAIPFVMCGTSKVKRVVQPAVNDELATLTPFRIEIPGYRYDTPEERAEFRNFLDLLDDELPFDEFSRLGQVDDNGLSPLADKIHVATYGILRLVGYLIVEAGELAIADGSAHIEEHHLWASIELQHGILQAALRADVKEGAIARPVLNPFRAPAAKSKAPGLVKSGYREVA